MSRVLRYLSKNFAVYADTFQVDDNGTMDEIEYVEQPAVVIAVPVLATGELLLVEQWRPLLGLTVLECPGGKSEPGETVEATIRRELSEEIGMEPGAIRRLGSFFASVGSSTEKIHCVVASDFRETGRDAEDVKRMYLRRFSKADLKARITREILTDGKSHVALSAFLFGEPGRRDG